LPAGPRGGALRYVAEDGSTGYSVAAGRLVSALRGRGVAVEMLGVADGLLTDPARFVAHSRDDRPLATTAPAGATTVMHLVPEHLARVRASTDGPVVIHTVWETDELPAHWPSLLNQCDGVLVPTEWNREVFRACGVQAPIEVVPHVACVPGVTGAPALDLPDDAIVFYNISRWDERKVPSLALRAFLEAFTADDPVAFVIKTGLISEARQPDGWGQTSRLYWTSSWHVARLIRQYPRPPKVYLHVDEWSDERIAVLHARGDCYLTLTHGEGWGIGGFDACAYGNPVIATGWGGHMAYLEGSPWLVDYDLVAVDNERAVGSYAPSQRWGDPHVEHAVSLLRGVASDLAGARAAAQPMRERIARDYAPPVVADRLLDALARFGVFDAS
jgi:glycosyltransferase involved in cell wall biosynthesis